MHSYPLIGDQFKVLREFASNIKVNNYLTKWIK